jgi:hypothetical protein
MYSMIGICRACTAFGILRSENSIRYSDNNIHVVRLHGRAFDTFGWAMIMLQNPDKAPVKGIRATREEGTVKVMRNVVDSRVLYIYPPQGMDQHIHLVIYWRFHTGAYADSGTRRQYFMLAMFERLGCRQRDYLSEAETRDVVTARPSSDPMSAPDAAPAPRGAIRRHQFFTDALQKYNQASSESAQNA